jgi:hypothetical protein
VAAVTGGDVALVVVLGVIGWMLVGQLIILWLIAARRTARLPLVGPAETDSFPRGCARAALWAAGWPRLVAVEVRHIRRARAARKGGDRGHG